jgi:hypothetical protein
MRNVEQKKRLLSPDIARKKPSNNLFSCLLNSAFDRFLELRKLDDFYARVAGADSGIPFFDRMLGSIVRTIRPDFKMLANTALNSTRIARYCESQKGCASSLYD